MMRNHLFKLLITKCSSPRLVLAQTIILIDGCCGDTSKEWRWSEMRVKTRMKLPPLAFMTIWIIYRLISRWLLTLFFYCRIVTMFIITSSPLFTSVVFTFRLNSFRLNRFQNARTVDLDWGLCLEPLKSCWGESCCKKPCHTSHRNWFSIEKEFCVIRNRKLTESFYIKNIFPSFENGKKKSAQRVVH